MRISLFEKSTNVMVIYIYILIKPYETFFSTFLIFCSDYLPKRINNKKINFV